jgi:hypothetical protein
MDAMTLLREAQEAGLAVHIDGDNLVVEGPRTAAPVVEKLRQHKAEVLAALRDPCCPACGRRTGPPIDITDGCETHHITPEMVGHWWRLAREMGAEVSWCHCCGGPSPSGALACRRCEG